MTFGKSRPLAIISVPMRIFASPLAKDSKISFLTWLEETSESSRNTFAEGKNCEISSYALSVP